MQVVIRGVSCPRSHPILLWLKLQASNPVSPFSSSHSLPLFHRLQALIIIVIFYLSSKWMCVKVCVSCLKCLVKLYCLCLCLCMSPLFSKMRHDFALIFAVAKDNLLFTLSTSFYQVANVSVLFYFYFTSLYHNEIAYFLHFIMCSYIIYCVVCVSQIYWLTLYLYVCVLCWCDTQNIQDPPPSSTSLKSYPIDFIWARI